MQIMHIRVYACTRACLVITIIFADSIGVTLFIIVIVIVISRLLESPQKRSRGNQLIYRRLTKNEIDRQGVKILRVRQADSHTLWWMLF